MKDYWKQLPNELLSGIFKYLGPVYVKIPIIKYMLLCDIIYMIEDCSFEDMVEAKNLTGCFLHTEYGPKNNIDWGYISRQCQLSESFILRYHNHIHWFWASYKQELSEKIIDTFSDRLDWWNISLSQSLSDYIKNKYKDRIMLRLNRKNRSKQV